VTNNNTGLVRSTSH